MSACLSPFIVYIQTRLFRSILQALRTCLPKNAMVSEFNSRTQQGFVLLMMSYHKSETDVLLPV